MSETQTPRMTESRKVMLEALKHTGFHPTADELYERIRRRLPRVSLGTVYRNLEYLSNHGLVAVLRDPDGRRRFDAMPDEHCHVWCATCGRVEDVRLRPSASPRELLEDDPCYEISGYDLSFVGTCPSCLAERDRKGEDSTSST